MPAPGQNGVYLFFAETEHVVAFEIRRCRHIGKFDIILIGRPAQHVDSRHEDVRQVVDFLVVQITARQVHSDDVISPHLPSQVGRIVVDHSAVDQNHAVDAYRCEEARNGHGRTQGCDKPSGSPYLGLAGNHVRGHAYKRNRQLEEISLVLVTYRNRGYYVVDILAEDKA